MPAPTTNDGETTTVTDQSIPIFDADNHFYADREVFTKFLPDRFKGLVQYVDVKKGRTKIMVKGPLTSGVLNETAPAGRCGR
jgi:hypothetical protein